MANNIVQLKRTNTSGRTPNTTASYATNSQYISAGELALNMADGILYTSNGSALITVGANLVNQRITNSFTIDSNKALRFQTVNTSAVAYFIQQNDDNFVFYTTNTSYGARPVYSIFANSNSSEFSFSTPVRFNANVTTLTANGSTGAAGQVLTSNGTTVYWSSAGVGTVTSVGSGNGLTGGPITTTGSLSVLANTGIVANSTGTFVNATYIGTLTANNASFLGGIAAASYVNSSQLSANLSNYQTTAGLSANVATLTANNASFLGGTAAASYQLNSTLAANVATLAANSATFLGAAGNFGNSSGVYTSGVVNAATIQVGTSVVANSSRLVLGTAVALQANGGIGTAGQVLHSNGTTVYWDVDDQGVTSVATGSGLTGGTITTTGTVSVLANTGIVANATGIYVNAAYINTISSNSATFANSSVTNTFTVGTAAYFIANGNLGIGTSGPGYKFVVAENSNTNLVTQTINSNTGTGSTTIHQFQVGTDRYVNLTTNYGSQYFQVVGSNITTIYKDFDTQFFRNNAGTVNMVINSSGNIGIGNSSPTQKVQVQGSILTQNGAASANTDRNAGIRFWTDLSFGAELHFGSVGSGQSDSWATALYGRRSDPVAVRIGSYATTNTTAQNTFSEYVTVMNSGNVGIGNTAPNARLQVTGTANVSGNVAIAGITTFSANIILGSSGLSANGGFGTAGQFLTSNGSATYWSTAAASVNTTAQFAWTNTHVFTANVTIGNTTTNNNALLISQIGISNPNSFTGGTLTTVNNLNTLIVGPYTVASGNTLNIVTGSRLVII